MNTHPKFWMLAPKKLSKKKLSQKNAIFKFAVEFSNLSLKIIAINQNGLMWYFIAWMNEYASKFFGCLLRKSFQKTLIKFQGRSRARGPERDIEGKSRNRKIERPRGEAKREFGGPGPTPIEKSNGPGEQQSNTSGGLVLRKPEGSTNRCNWQAWGARLGHRKINA